MEKAKKLLCCSLCGEEGLKLQKLYEQRIIDCLLFFNNLKDDFKEIYDFIADEVLILSKQFIIYGEKVKIRIHENIKKTMKTN